MPEEDKPIEGAELKYAIVVACSRDWIPYACVTLLSAHSNLRMDADYYLISDTDATDAELRPLTRAQEVFGAKLTPCLIDGAAFANIDFGNFHRSTVYRLALHSIISGSYDRVLYLDSDILVLDNIGDLVEFDLRDNPVGVVEDVGMYDEFNKAAEQLRQSIGFDKKEPYFNSGVMLFDWKKTLSQRILSDAREVLAEKKLMFVDQDALNIVLKGKWAALPIEYNVMSRTAPFIRKKTIRHFTRGSKPWAKRYGVEDRVYRKHYRRILKLLGCGGVISRPELVNDCLGLMRRLEVGMRRARRRVLGRPVERRKDEEEEEQRLERLREHIASVHGADR